TSGLAVLTADTDAGPNFTDFYVLKLTPSGTGFTTASGGWAESFGAEGDDAGRAITFDTSGNVLVAGSYHFNVDFDFGPGAFSVPASGQADAVVLKLDGSGKTLWARSLGGFNNDSATGIRTDAAGNVYTVGSFTDAVDFNPLDGSYTLRSAGGTDGFLSKLDSGGHFVWATQ